MTREEQLAILAELYARVEDGEASLHSTVTEQDPFYSPGFKIRLELSVDKTLKSVARGGNGIYNVTPSTHTGSSHTHTTNSNGYLTAPSPALGTHSMQFDGKEWRIVEDKK